MLKNVLVTLLCGLCLLPTVVRPVASHSAMQLTAGPFAEVVPLPSPDGKWLLFEYFHADRPDKPQLWILPAQGDFSRAHPLVDDENFNAEASWSPDSRWVSYERIATTDHGQLFKRNIYTGETVQLTHLPTESIPGDSTSWSIQGKIAFEMNGDIYEVDEEGGDVKKLFEIRSHYPAVGLSSVRWSPDGTKLCFVAQDPSPHDFRTYIWIADVNANKAWSLTEGDFPWWVDNGRILLCRMLSANEARILMFRLNGGHPRIITKGYLDVTPSFDPTGKNIFFARGLSSRRKTNNLNLFEGFHVWKTRMPTLAGSNVKHSM